MWTEREGKYNDQEELDAKYGEGFSAVTNLCIFGVLMFICALLSVWLYGKWTPPHAG